MKDYLKRSRGEWPPLEQLDELQQMPLFLVLVGSKQSQEPDLEARNSWSVGEMILISKLPKIIKQGLIAAKCIFKHCVKKYRDDNTTGDGRSRVGSYHMKTTLLNHLENTPPSKIYSAFQAMMNVFTDLCVYLKRGYLPHYFLPECNLLATVGSAERQLAIQCIQNIICDPIVAILKCPSDHTEIYGDICPDDLVGAFRYVAAHPNCQRSSQELMQLLSWLDQWRQTRYLQQRERDEQEGVSGRPEPTGLVNMLEKITNV